MRGLADKKNPTKYKILNYMFNYGHTSKVELAKKLNLSMPTVLSNVSELMEKGIIEEKGELESTGGRKARQIGLNAEHAYSLGINITANHLALVLVNFSGEMVRWERSRLVFEPSVAYCSQVAERVYAFYEGIVSEEQILGVGIALPGIVDDDLRMLTKSHALKLNNYSLKTMEQVLPFSAYFENDANAAMLAEKPELLGDAVYLSLNNTLGGAICMNGRLFTGKSQKAGEFGHTLLVPGGKQCYCGKSGCADAYCAASVLTAGGTRTLEEFMQQLKADEECQRTWDIYLEDLAMLISNVRMAFDADIILGGDVGGYLPEYMMELGERAMKYNLFDGDSGYLKACTYKREAAAVGAAKHFLKKYIEEI